MNLVVLEGVPLDVYRSMLQLATLPPAYEGMGTRNLALTLGKPFIEYCAMGTYIDHLSSIDKKRATAIGSLIGRIFDNHGIDLGQSLRPGYTSSKQVSEFEQFIQDCADRDSATYQLFQKASDLLRANDGLTHVLEKLLKDQDWSP